MHDSEVVRSYIKAFANYGWTVEHIPDPNGGHVPDKSTFKVRPPGKICTLDGLAALFEEIKEEHGDM